MRQPTNGIERRGACTAGHAFQRIDYAKIGSFLSDKTQGGESSAAARGGDPTVIGDLDPLAFDVLLRHAPQPRLCTLTRAARPGGRSAHQVAFYIAGADSP